MVAADMTNVNLLLSDSVTKEFKPPWGKTMMETRIPHPEPTRRPHAEHNWGPMFRILLIDECNIYRKGLRGLLEKAIADAEVLEASSAPDSGLRGLFG